MQTADHIELERISSDVGGPGEASTPVATPPPAAASKTGIAALFVYSAGAFLLALIGLIQLWNPVNEAVQANQPIQAGEAAGTEVEAVEGLRDFATEPASLFGLDITNSPTLIIVFVVLAGILGSTINALRSHAKHTARGDFNVRYWAWYAIRPPIGAATALALYFLLTAGLITISTEEVGVLSPAALAAFSIVAGLASKAAIDRIRDAIESLFGIGQTPTPSTDQEHIQRHLAEQAESELEKGV